MPHPLVTQLRFTRDEFVRGLQGLTDDEARRRFQAMNSISWMTLTTEGMQAPLAEGFGSVGTFLRRTTYHYWYHLGEALAVRQMLGHGDLPDFVGDIDSHAPYRPE